MALLLASQVLAFGAGVSARASFDLRLTAELRLALRLYAFLLGCAASAFLGMAGWILRWIE